MVEQTTSGHDVVTAFKSIFVVRLNIFIPSYIFKIIVIMKLDLFHSYTH